MSHVPRLGRAPRQKFLMPFCDNLASHRTVLTYVASVAFAVACGLAVAPAQAQTAQQRAECSITAKARPDAVISSCSAVLSAHNGNGRQRAADLTVRGRAHRALSQLDGAIADYTEAIKVDPAYALAYY